jgi:hypothetical protein
VIKEQTAKALDRLTSGESVDDAIANAFCQGVTSLANTGQLPDASDWRDFLIAQVEQRLIGASHNVVEDKVQQFDAAANLSAINPGVANYYVRGCAARL